MHTQHLRTIHFQCKSRLADCPVDAQYIEHSGWMG